MRLICPNCSAQYEIDASLIPDEGRDVQCSNCGHNWFELPPAVEAAAPPPELDVEDEDVGATPSEEAIPEFADEVEAPEFEAEPEFEDEPDVQDEDEYTPEPEDEPERATEAEPEPDKKADPRRADEDEEEDDWNWPKSRAATLNVPRDDAPARERPRRPAELAALEILKEEADRELARRAHPPEPEPIETQPDLVPQNDPRDRETPSRALRARMARLRGEDEDEDQAAASAAEEEEAYRPPRRDLLPDIDEINSSLRPAGLARGERSEEEEAQHRRGFRVGFIGIVVVVVLMIAAYAQAPAIAGVLPGTETALIGFVDWANGIRDGLSGLFGA